MISCLNIELSCPRLCLRVRPWRCLLDPQDRIEVAGALRLFESSLNCASCVTNCVPSAGFSGPDSVTALPAVAETRSDSQVCSVEVAETVDAADEDAEVAVGAHCCFSISSFQSCAVVGVVAVAAGPVSCRFPRIAACDPCRLIPVGAKIHLRPPR